jgi:hypothetical protein
MTWEYLLLALDRLTLNAEDAAMRLHIFLDIPKADNRVIIDHTFWRKELSRHNLPVNLIAKSAH